MSGEENKDASSQGDGVYLYRCAVPEGGKHVRCRRRIRGLLAAGLRLGFGVTFLGAILSQMFAAKSGFILVQSVELNDKPRIYGLVALLTVFAFIVNGAFLVWERQLSRHRPGGA